MSRLAFVVLLVLLGRAGVAAQTPATAPPSVAVADLSPLEQKDVDLLQLRAQLSEALKQIANLQAALGACQGQLGSYQAAQNAQALDAEARVLVANYEKAHPGFTINPKTGVTARKPAPDPEKK